MNKISPVGPVPSSKQARDWVQIVGEFAELALSSEHPCDLGSRCTVFMDTELVRAEEQGVPLQDICAGWLMRWLATTSRNSCGSPNRRLCCLSGEPLPTRLLWPPFGRFSTGLSTYTPTTGSPAQSGRNTVGARETLPEPLPRLQSCSGAKLRSFECQRCENRCQVNRVHIGARRFTSAIYANVIRRRMGNPADFSPLSGTVRGARAPPESHLAPTSGWRRIAHGLDCCALR